MNTSYKFINLYKFLISKIKSSGRITTFFLGLSFLFCSHSIKYFSSIFFSFNNFNSLIASEYKPLCIIISILIKYLYKLKKILLFRNMFPEPSTLFFSKENSLYKSS